MLVNVAAVLLQYCDRLSYSEEFSPKLIEYSAFMAYLISSTGRSLRDKAWFIVASFNLINISLVLLICFC